MYVQCLNIYWIVIFKVFSSTSMQGPVHQFMVELDYLSYLFLHYANEEMIL